MEPERVQASTTIEAPAEAVFAVLADPSAHADIDGTGWVRGSLDGDRITAAGQVVRQRLMSHWTPAIETCWHVVSMVTSHRPSTSTACPTWSAEP
jgi:hypothetical protein